LDRGLTDREHLPIARPMVALPNSVVGDDIVDVGYGDRSHSNELSDSTR
jgi:hypothetical protein